MTISGFFFFFFFAVDIRKMTISYRASGEPGIELLTQAAVAYGLLIRSVTYEKSWDPNLNFNYLQSDIFN